MVVKFYHQSSWDDEKKPCNIRAQNPFNIKGRKHAVFTNKRHVSWKQEGPGTQQPMIAKGG